MAAGSNKDGAKGAGENTDVDGSMPVDNPMEMIEVIVQRPHGVTDSHAYFSFNNVGGQYAYGKPVKMPRAMVEHLRQSVGVEYHADDKGNPVPSYTNQFHVVPA